MDISRTDETGLRCVRYESRLTMHKLKARCVFRLRIGVEITESWGVIEHGLGRTDLKVLG